MAKILELPRLRPRLVKLIEESPTVVALKPPETSSAVGDFARRLDEELVLQSAMRSARAVAELVAGIATARGEVSSVRADLMAALARFDELTQEH